MTRNLSRRDALRTFPLVGSGLLLTRCAGAPTVVSDIQAVLNDAATIYPVVERFIPAPFGGAVALVLTGLQSLVNLVAGSIAAGATTEGTVLVGLSSALAQVKADTALSGTASTALGDAIALIDDLGASSSGTTAQQVEVAVGAALLDVLEFYQPASATPTSSGISVASTIADARAHLAKIKGA